VDGDQEVCVWPTRGGVASLHCNGVQQSTSLRISADGRHFTNVEDIHLPEAPGPFRADHYADNADMELLILQDYPKPRRNPYALVVH